MSKTQPKTIKKSVNKTTRKTTKSAPIEMLSRNFSKSELSCNCGECEPIISDILVTRLQSLRDICGHSLSINSGYRCPKHNKAIGGAPNSMHTKGIAVDISTSGWGADKLHRFLSLAFSLGFNGIGIASNYFHIDVRSVAAMWKYNE